MIIIIYYYYYYYNNIPEGYPNWGLGEFTDNNLPISIHRREQFIDG